MMSRMRILLVGSAVFAIAATAVAWYIFESGNTFDDPRERVVFVSRGESFSSVVDSLMLKGVVRNRGAFLFVERILGGAGHVRIGKYLFRSGMSNREILTMLTSSTGAQTISVTIPEGTRARTQARIFARVLGIDSSRYARAVFDSNLVASFGLEGKSLEGYLTPDTYEFAWEQDEREIIRRQVERMKYFFADSLRERALRYGWSMHQALTFASIVEGEAVLAEDRPVISGVYHNRLRQGMRLEADPTIQYMITDGPRRILYADLRRDDPYNTYRYAGLPPGPVNNPGRAAILAALYPSENGYVYFVANGRGGHWFSRSYQEHMRYVRMYRHNRKKQG
jgi:UPF0755 protein